MATQTTPPVLDPCPECNKADFTSKRQRGLHLSMKHGIRSPVYNQYLRYKENKRKKQSQSEKPDGRTVEGRRAKAAAKESNGGKLTNANSHHIPTVLVSSASQQRTREQRQGQDEGVPDSVVTYCLGRCETIITDFALSAKVPPHILTDRVATLLLAKARG